MCKPIDNWGAPADFHQFQMDLGLKKQMKRCDGNSWRCGPPLCKWIFPTL